MKRRLWQGRADNLCGIYCALYVIRENGNLGSTQSKRDRAGLLALLASAERLNMLTAKRIAGSDGGYPAEEIIDIFNELPPRQRSGMRAHLLIDAIPDFDGNVGMLKPLLKRGGFAILDTAGGEHWVLAHKYEENGSAICFDPTATRQFVTRSRASSSDGVAFVPNKAKL